MGCVMQKTSGTFLICRRISVRFYLSVVTRFPFLRLGLLAYQIRQGMWRAVQILCGLLAAVDIKKGTDDLFLLGAGQLNYSVHLGSGEVRLLELLYDPQMRTRWLQFATIKAEAVGC